MVRGSPAQGAKQNGGRAALHVRFTGAVSLRRPAACELLDAGGMTKTDPAFTTQKSRGWGGGGWGAVLSI